MLNDILVVAGQVLSLFLMMGVGAVLTKRNIITDTGAAQMSSILLYIVSPCVIIDSLQREKEFELIRDMGISALIIAAVIVFGTALSLLFFKKESDGDRRILRFGVAYSNCGYMGLPLVQAALGQSAMVYAAAAVTGFNILVWTAGIFTIGGKKEISLSKALLNPGTIGFVIGFLLFWFEAPLPSILGGTVSMFAALNTPVAMLIVGTYIVQANLRRCFTQPRLYLMAGLRLVLIPALLVAALAPLRLPYELYAAAVITASAPTAAITTIFASRFKLDASLASQAVTFCTLLSILTMPVFAGIVRALCV